MSIPEVAAALGVSINTVRAMVKRGELRAERVRRPQGYTLRVHLPTQVPAPDTSGTSGQVPDAGRYQAPTNGLVPAEQQRAEALAQYAATLLAPVLAELGAARQHVATLAAENGRLQAELDAAQATTHGPQSEPPRPWWRRWWPR